MPLNIDDLRDELKAELQVQFGAVADEARLTKFCYAISKCVIEHFQQNADIVLSTGDIEVLPATFTANGFPVINKGEIEGVTLSNKIT